jgi:hypothetical protein
MADSLGDARRKRSGIAHSTDKETSHMRRLLTLAATGILVAATCVALGTKGAGATAAPATELQSDVQTSQTGETATANDVDTAKEFDVEDGAVNDVQAGPDTAEGGQSGDQQTGPAAAGQSTTAENNTGG